MDGLLQLPILIGLGLEDFIGFKELVIGPLEVIKPLFLQRGFCDLHDLTAAWSLIAWLPEDAT